MNDQPAPTPPASASAADDYVIRLAVDRGLLDAGQVVERGTHAQLLGLQGRYARMWSLQQSAT